MSGVALDDGVAAQVVAGLTAARKWLPTNLLYDHVGEALFRNIMQLPEYYLTQVEVEILQMNAAAVATAFGTDAALSVVELGAGDGSKSMLLLAAFAAAGAEVEYIPIDIAPTALDALTANVRERFAGLKISPRCGDYLTELHALHQSDHRPELILFLGSNIGNYADAEAIALLKSLRREMSADDAILCGFDLRKDPWLVHQAYNDRFGLTRAFNLNLITRLNREYGGDAQIDQFDHYEHYDPIAGEARSYLVSRKQQTVHYGHLDLTVDFARNEPIATEISRKYDLDEIDALAAAAGLERSHCWLDCRHHFADVLLRRASAVA